MKPNGRAVKLPGKFAVSQTNAIPTNGMSHFAPVSISFLNGGAKRDIPPDRCCFSNLPMSNLFHPTLPDFSMNANGSITRTSAIISAYFSKKKRSYFTHRFIFLTAFIHVA